MQKEKIYGWIMIFIILTWLPASLAQADGGYFSSRSVAVSADQRAIIIKNGNEISMTFSTGYTGEGEDFGWIIPTPVPPATYDVNEAGGNGDRAFELLDEYSAPQVVYETHSRSKGKKGVDIESAPLVSVYGMVTLEHYKVSILRAADASALLNWLHKNGYQVNPEAQEVFDAYVDQNLGFVTVKLNPSEKRHYQNEFLSPLTIKYQYDDLIFPLRISSVSTTETVKIILYVIAESTVYLSNFPTSKRMFEEQPSGSVDPEEYIETCIRKAIGRKGRGLVAMWRGIPDFYEYEEIEEIIDELMKIPFPKGKGVYLTRLEARMDRIRFPLLIIQ